MKSLQVLFTYATRHIYFSRYIYFLPFLTHQILQCNPLLQPTTNFSKHFFITIFNLQSLFIISSIAVAPSNPSVFREYIGYVDLTENFYHNVSFSDVPINPNVEFHFILSFAIDFSNNTNEDAIYFPQGTDGHFYPYWDTEILTPSEVLSIKRKHPNVKVAVSTGGFTYEGGNASFHSASVNTWVSSAVSSLTDIIKQYNLDGIDIYYTNFTDSPERFALCMGSLITTLKENGVIQFASIAPSDHEIMANHYLELWRNYGQHIDYVNFQFYEYDTHSTSVDQFIDYFDVQSTLYKGGNLLASIISDDSGGLTAQNGFFAAVNILRSSRKNFVGIFVWCADLSKPKGFLYENQSQALLATPQY